ncbi:hypothetical protein BH10PLA2_BH10PLA2_39940 [soil metagenome]|jgi:hypothetical protein|uniref:Uncharacterized protein n=1 Tax=Rhodopseudomonas palustris TaxID=1076 RepID=A0A933S0K3_RHOPL|nr:hypothetical protein [Rhodopseudomonas palustris]
MTGAAAISIHAVGACPIRLIEDKSILTFMLARWTKSIDATVWPMRPPVASQKPLCGDELVP